MKLNKWQKQAFVNAVMQDIPSVDYLEDFRAFVMKEGLKTLPKEILAIHNDPKTIGYLDKQSQWFSGLSTVYYYAVLGWLPKEDEAIKLAREDSETKILAQAERCREIKAKLQGAINSCSTLKQAETLLPEFIKYLPKDTGSVIDRTMPVIADLVVTLTAAGWPKESEPSEQLAA